MSKSVSRTSSSWFCGRCGHVHKWRERGRILSFRHEQEPNEVVLYRGFPMPMGEVENFLATTRQRGSGSEATCGMLESIRILFHGKRHCERH